MSLTSHCGDELLQATQAPKPPRPPGTKAKARMSSTSLLQWCMSWCVTSGSAMTYGRSLWSPMARLMASSPITRFHQTLPPASSTRSCRGTGWGLSMSRAGGGGQEGRQWL